MSKKKEKDKVEESAKSKAPKAKKTAKKKIVAPVVPSGDVVSVEAEPVREVKPKAPARRRAAKKIEPAPVEIFIAEAEISLRAYFIAQHRQHHGLPGDEVSDWVAAEQQLRDEATRKA